LKQISEKFLRQVESKICRKFCQVNSTHDCPNEYCHCKVAAELTAYMMSVIPDPYYKYTIHDFHGRSTSGEILIDKKIALKAKGALIEYCWGNMSLDDLNKKSSKELDKYSVMNLRRNQGKNVVIYSDSPGFKNAGSAKGKTLSASLIMKEAIKSRILPGRHVETYDWIRFNVLKDMLKKDDMQTAMLKSCDWLVIDDIIRTQGRNSQSYIASLIDPFISERLSDGLPTILVFRFDTNDIAISAAEEFGVGINQILTDTKTTKISLVS